MERILLTGASGFIGNNIIGCFTDSKIFAPARSDLDLFDANAVREYLINNGIDIIVHAAHPNPVKSEIDAERDSMIADSLELFYSIYSCKDICKKIIILGSGAEYDKSRDICSITEADFGVEIPQDEYGLAKYVGSVLAKDDANVYVLRIFGCYGPGDYHTKFITHAIRSVLNGNPITIRRDCWFDYIHVDDLGRVIDYIVHNDMPHHVYNVGGCERHLLSEIAEKVCEAFDVPVRIEFLSDGLANEYTANSNLLANDIPGYPWTSLDAGINRQIAYEMELYNSEQKDLI